MASWCASRSCSRRKEVEVSPLAPYRPEDHQVQPPEGRLAQWFPVEALLDGQIGVAGVDGATRSQAPRSDARLSTLDMCSYRLQIVALSFTSFRLAPGSRNRPFLPATLPRVSPGSLSAVCPTP